MISDKSYTEDWIIKQASKLKIRDPSIVEKVIYALHLLELLSQSGITFIFKGGTSLILHYNTPKRLSVDIDIIVHGNLKISNHLPPLDHHFQKIIPSKTEEDGLKKEEFRITYRSVLTGREDSINLDVVYESSLYAVEEQKAISSPLIHQVGPPFEVNVPSLEDLLGDKLTAYAPNTTGIEYGRPLEIIKQLFDVATLFQQTKDFEVVTDTFRKIGRRQTTYTTRKVESTDAIIDDVYNTSLCISTNGRLGKGSFNKLEKGIRALRDYTINEPYSPRTAVLNASIAAYASQCIKHREPKPKKYRANYKMEGWSTGIKELDALRRTNREAFYYWYQALKTRNR